MPNKPFKRVTNSWLYFTLISLLFLQTGCHYKNSSVELIIMDFPHGENRLHVYRNGEAFLYYGASPEAQILKNGTFDINELYEQLKPRLYNNVPREKWPNPQSKAGMVTISIAGKEEKDYLIFDQEKFSALLFDKARKNRVGQLP